MLNVYCKFAKAHFLIVYLKDQRKRNINKIFFMKSKKVLHQKKTTYLCSLLVTK